MSDTEIDIPLDTKNHEFRGTITPAGPNLAEALAERLG